MGLWSSKIKLQFVKKVKCEFNLNISLITGLGNIFHKIMI